MAFEFIKDLNESRLFSSKSNYSRYTLREVTDITFLNFLTIQVLRNEIEYKNKIRSYVYNTLAHRDYKKYQSSGNDLYQLLYIIFNAEELVNDLKRNDYSNNSLARRISIRKEAVNLWLTNVYKPINTVIDHRFLYSLEQSLKIENQSYKAIRKMVECWGDITPDKKQLAVTRLLQALRYKASRSELLPWLERFSRDKSLEIKNVDNAETGEKYTGFNIVSSALEYSDLFKNEKSIKTGINTWNNK